MKNLMLPVYSSNVSSIAVLKEKETFFYLALPYSPCCLLTI